MSERISSAATGTTMEMATLAFQVRPLPSLLWCCGGCVVLVPGGSDCDEVGREKISGGLIGRYPVGGGCDWHAV